MWRLVRLFLERCCRGKESCSAATPENTVKMIFMPRWCVGCGYREADRRSAMNDDIRDISPLCWHGHFKAKHSVSAPLESCPLHQLINYINSFVWTLKLSTALKIRQKNTAINNSTSLGRPEPESSNDGSHDSAFLFVALYWVFPSFSDAEFVNAFGHVL